LIGLVIKGDMIHAYLSYNDVIVGFTTNVTNDIRHTTNDPLISLLNGHAINKWHIRTGKSLKKKVKLSLYRAMEAHRVVRR
jgi:hypothetical protein